MSTIEQLALQFCKRCLKWEDAIPAFPSVTGGPFVIRESYTEHFNYSDLASVFAAAREFCKLLHQELALKAYPDGTFAAAINETIMAFSDDPKEALMGACLTAASLMKEAANANGR